MTPIAPAFETAAGVRKKSWRYAASEPMPETDAILAGVVDMRIPLTFSLEDCAIIARIIRTEVSKADGGGNGVAAATTSPTF